MTNTRLIDMNIQIDLDIKAKAEPILAAIGLSVSDVLNLTLHQICLKKKIPFEISAVQLTENGYTPEFEAEILADAEELYTAVANGTAKFYRNTAEFSAALDAEDAEDD